MLKTGIYKTEDLSDIKNIRSFTGKLKRASITLYDNSLYNVENCDEWAEHILLLFSDRRGAFKRTYRMRFDDFDSLCISCISEIFDPQTSLKVHDTGVSDGRTACDFFLKLADHHPDIRYFASDWEPTLKIIESGSGKVTLDSHNNPLEIVFPPFVFNLLSDLKIS